MRRGNGNRISLQQRTSEALKELRSQRKPWNPPPLERRGGASGADREEQETLARARELRGTGLAYNKIASALNSEGQPTKRGGPWYAMSVRSVLRTAESMAA